MNLWNNSSHNTCISRYSLIRQEDLSVKANLAYFFSSPPQVFPLLLLFLRTQLLCYIRGPTAPPPSFAMSMSINAIVLVCCLCVAIFYPNVGFLIRCVFGMTCSYVIDSYRKVENSPLSNILHIRRLRKKLSRNFFRISCFL